MSKEYMDKCKGTICFLTKDKVLEELYKAQITTKEKIQRLCNKFHAETLYKKVPDASLLSIIMRNRNSTKSGEQLLLKGHIPAKNFIGDISIIAEIMKKRYRENELDEDDLLRLYKHEWLTSEDIVDLLISTNQEKAQILLKRMLEKRTFVSSLPKTKLMKLYAEHGKINSKTLAKNINWEAVIGLFRYGQISKENFMKITTTLYKEFKPTSDELFELFGVYEQDKPYISGKDVLQLVKKGIIDDAKLMDVYEKQKAMKSGILFKQAFNDEIVSDKDYLEYFTADRVLANAKNEAEGEEFVKFYKELLSNQEEQEREEFEKKLVNQHVINNKNNPQMAKDLVFLFNKGIIDAKKILPYVDTDVIEQLYFDDKISINEIVKSYFNGLINQIQFNQIINKEELKKYIIEGDVTKETVLEGYMLNKLTVEDIKALGSEYIDSIVQLLETNLATESKEIYLAKLEEMYLNHAINYDKLEEIRKNGNITEDEFKLILERFNEEEEIEKIKQYGEIINIAEPESKESTGIGLDTDPAKPTITIDSNMRNDFIINKLGNIESEKADNVIAINITEGALKGYKFIAIRNLGIVILEHMNDKKSNATYVLPLQKGIEEAQNSNKSDLKCNNKAKQCNHTKRWKENLIRKIAEIQQDTLRAGRDDIVYAEKLVVDPETSQLTFQISENCKSNRKTK